MRAGKGDLNSSFFILSQLILLIALVHGGSPSARSNWTFFMPIFILFIHTAFFCASDNPISDFVFIQPFAILIPTSTDYILLRNYQPELRKIGQKKHTSEMTFTERLVWSVSLLATSRGIGWAHEPTDHIPPRPTSSRGKFIASQLLWMIFYLTFYDVVFIVIRENLSLGTGGASLVAFGWWYRTTSWLYILRMYCTLSGLYVAVSILSVATGLYKPRDCPHMFGSPLDAYTLRNCWGYVCFSKTFVFHPPHKIAQSRLAPDASQAPHKQRKISCGRPSPPKRDVYDLLQAFHRIFNLWAYPRHR